MSDRRFTLRAPRQRPEEDLQRRVVEMLDAYLPSEIWFSASLAGIPLSPQAARRAKELGSRKGAPDISLIFPDGQTFYIEIKAPNGTLTPEQKALQATLGDRFAVCRSRQEVMVAIDRWMAPRGLRFLQDAEAVRRSLKWKAA